MESKILIDLDMHRQERILIQYKFNEDDLRDKLLGMFLQTALPDGGSWKIRDGYCRISILGDDKYFVAEIVPLHPTHAPGHIEQIQKNIDAFMVGTGATIEPGDADKKDISFADEWLKENLPHPLYKRWVDEFLYAGESANKSSQK
jgi:hypothetical protein